MCRAVSNAFSKPALPAKSCHPNSHGTTMRWPLEEMGRNSARPCTMPSTMAWRIGTSAGLGRGHDAWSPGTGLVVVATVHDARTEGGAERSGVGEVRELDVGGAQRAGDV